MTGPIYFATTKRLLPEYRAINGLRLFAQGTGLIVVLCSLVFLWSGEGPLWSQIATAALLVVGAPVIVFFACFLWTPLRASAARAAKAAGAEGFFTFSRMGVAPAGSLDFEVEGAGWALLERECISLWRANSSLSFSSGATMIVRVAWADLVRCERTRIAKGHAYPRLALESRLGIVADIALTNASGQSLAGVSDADVDRLISTLHGMRLPSE